MLKPSVALKKFDLHWFEGIVVGEENPKTLSEIYKTTLSRFNLDPEECLFIDDNLRNVKAAELLNIPSIQFKSPEQLEKELKKRSII